jgi:hypothetical protein
MAATEKMSFEERNKCLRERPKACQKAEHLAKHGELENAPGLLEKLRRINAATARPLLEEAPRARPRLPRKGPEWANRVAGVSLPQGFSL